MPSEVECPLKEYLTRQCGIAEDYINARIKTLFLDGKPVDDFARAIVHDGSTLTLSGAMPGLVGAMMRRGSPYALFRHSITHADDEKAAQRITGLVRIKLFNVIIRELGRHFLERGVLAGADELSAFFREEGEEFWNVCRTILMNGNPSGGPGVERFLSSAQGLVTVTVKIVE